MAKYLDKKGLDNVASKLKSLLDDKYDKTGGDIDGNVTIINDNTLKIDDSNDERTLYSKLKSDELFLHNSDNITYDIKIKPEDVDFNYNIVKAEGAKINSLELNGTTIYDITTKEIEEESSALDSEIATTEAIVSYVNSKIGAAFKPKVVNILPTVGEENTFYFVPKLELKASSESASETSFVLPLSTTSPYIKSGFVNVEAHVNIPVLASSWNIMHFTTASNANTQAGLRIVNNSAGQVGLGNSTADAAAVTVTGLKAGDNILTLSYDFDTKKAIMGVNGNKAERELTLSEIRSLQFSNRSDTVYNIDKVYVAMSGAAASGSNIYDEYIYIGSRWEQIGSTEVTFALATDKVDGLMYHLDKAFLDKISGNIKYVGDDNNNLQIEDSGNYLRLATNGGNIIMHTTDDIYLSADDFYVDADISFNKTVDEVEIQSQTGLNISAGNSSINANSLLKAEKGFEAKLNTSGTTYDTTSQMKLTSGGFTISGNSVKKDGSGTTYLNQIKTSNSKMTIDANDMSINVEKTFDVNVKNNDITLDSANGYMHIQPSGNIIYGRSKVDIDSGGEMSISGTTTRVSADTYIETTGTDIRIKNSEVNIGCTNTSTSTPDSNNINMLANQQQSLTKNQTIIANSSNSAASPKTTKVAIKEDDVVIGLERTNSSNISSLNSSIDVGFKIGSDSEIKAYGPIKVYDEITSPNGGSISFDSDGWPVIKGTGGIILRANNSDVSSIRIQDYIDDDTGLHQNIMINTPGKALYNTKEIATVDQIPSVSDKVAKAGDTITGAISRESGGSWISGRDNAAIKQIKHTTSSGSSWNPVASVKTNAGNWTIGNVGDNNLTFSYDTDENYAAGRNTSSVFSITPDGTFTGTVSEAGHADTADSASFASVAEDVESENTVTIKSYNASVKIEPETYFTVNATNTEINSSSSADINTDGELCLNSQGDTYIYGHKDYYDKDTGGSMINLCDDIVLSCPTEAIKFLAGRTGDLEDIYIKSKRVDLRDTPGGIIFKTTSDEDVVEYNKYGIEWRSGGLTIGDLGNENGSYTVINNDAKCTESLSVSSSLSVGGSLSVDGNSVPTIYGGTTINSPSNKTTNSSNYIKFKTSYGTFMIAWGIRYIPSSGSNTIYFPTSFTGLPTVTISGDQENTDYYWNKVATLENVQPSYFVAQGAGGGISEGIHSLHWFAIGKCS